MMFNTPIKPQISWLVVVRSSKSKFLHAELITYTLSEII